MSDEQVKFNSSGPVFEFGPGWGAKTKNWLRKYFLKAVVPVVILVLALMLLTRSLDKLSEKVQLTATPDLNKSAITLTIAHGDSRPLLARKAIAKYLEQNLDKNFSPGQKLFAEEKLRVRLAIAKSLKTDQRITISNRDIQSALDQSLLLNKYELPIWNSYAEKAGIK